MILTTFAVVPNSSIPLVVLVAPDADDEEVEVAACPFGFSFDAIVP